MCSTPDGVRTQHYFTGNFETEMLNKCVVLQSAPTKGNVPLGPYPFRRLSDDRGSIYVSVQPAPAPPTKIPLVNFYVIDFASPASSVASAAAAPPAPAAAAAPPAPATAGRGAIDLTSSS